MDITGIAEAIQVNEIQPSIDSLKKSTATAAGSWKYHENGQRIGKNFQVCICFSGYN